MRLPAERHRRQTVVLRQGMCACCSCCCCCLHSLGGLIGAAVGSTTKPHPETGRHPASAAGPYWLVLFLFMLVMIATPIWRLDPGTNGVITLLFVMPVVQLIASLATVPFLLFTRRDQQEQRLASLGRITLGTLAGTIIGGVVVLLLLAAAGAG